MTDYSLQAEYDKYAATVEDEYDYIDYLAECPGGVCHATHLPEDEFTFDDTAEF